MSKSPLLTLGVNSILIKINSGDIFQITFTAMWLLIHIITGIQVFGALLLSTLCRMIRLCFGDIGSTEIIYAFSHLVIGLPSWSRGSCLVFDPICPLTLPMPSPLLKSQSMKQSRVACSEQQQNNILCPIFSHRTHPTHRK